MKTLFQCLLIVGITLTAIYWVSTFALSGYTHPQEGWAEEKPWLPYSRLVLGAVGISGIIFFMGLMIFTIYRER